MRHIKARLRVYLRTAKCSGSEESKEICIDRFLDEVTDLVTEEALERMPDDDLGGWLLDWIRHAPDTSVDQRRQAVSSAINRSIICPYTLFSASSEDNIDQESPPNVVNLFRR